MIKRFLVVDDQASLRQTLHDVIIFLDPEADVTLVANGQECLQAVQERVPDVILLDLNMPVLNGIETAKRLASHPARSDFVIIAMTGQSAQQELITEMNTLCDGFLRKPFSIDDLSEVLQQLE